MLTLTQQDLRLRLSALGIPSFFWQLADTTFATVGDTFIPEVWQAWVDSLRRNAPHLLTGLDIGGGKTRQVPRWIEGAGDCENHALMCFAHAMTGNWSAAAQGGAKVGRTYGIAFYDAMPRPQNRARNGAHAVMWWIGHDGAFRVWEPGDGEEQPWVPEEYASARFGIAA